MAEDADHSSGQNPGHKPCARCGVDCTDRARLKDARGRYFCRACYDGAVAAMARRIIDSAPAPTSAERDAGVPIVATPPDTYALAPTPEVRPKPMRRCPDCGQEVASDEAQCDRCGFNTVLNERVEAPEGELVTAEMVRGILSCGKCGYSLRNLKSLRCPECGAANRVPDKSDWMRQDSREAVRRVYIRSAVYFGIGMGGFLMLAGLDASSRASRTGMGGFEAFGREVLAYSISFAVDLVCTVGAYLVCCALWLGMAERLTLVLLRLTGFLSIVACILYFTGGLNVFAVVIAGTAYVLFLFNDMDLEMSDAWLVAAATLAAKVAGGFALAMTLKGLGIDL